MKNEYVINVQNKSMSVKSVASCKQLSFQARLENCQTWRWCHSSQLNTNWCLPILICTFHSFLITATEFVGFFKGVQRNVSTIDHFDTSYQAGKRAEEVEHLSIRSKVKRKILFFPASNLLLIWAWVYCQLLVTHESDFSLFLRRRDFQVIQLSKTIAVQGILVRIVDEAQLIVGNYLESEHLEDLSEV